MENDLRTLRDRFAAAADDADLDRSALDELGAAAGLGTTTVVTTYPTTAAVVYALQPTDVSGEETEGAAAVYTSLSGPPIFAANTGTAVPPQGTRVLYHACGGRYCFRYDG